MPPMPSGSTAPRAVQGQHLNQVGGQQLKVVAQPQFQVQVVQANVDSLTPGTATMSWMRAAAAAVSTKSTTKARSATNSTTGLRTVRNIAAASAPARRWRFAGRSRRANRAGSRLVRANGLAWRSAWPMAGNWFS